MIESFKKIFPRTYGYYIFFIPGFILLSLNYQWLYDKLPEPVLLAFTTLGIMLIAIPILAWAFEVLSKAFPLFTIILNILTRVADIFLTSYVKVMKFIIKRAVLDIIDEKNITSKETVLFRRQANDDHYWERVISFDKIKSIELKIKPSPATSYWRLGFKFSVNEVFTAARHGPNFPLLHLTKDDDTTLKADYYDEKTERKQENILENYSSEEVTLLIERLKDHLKVDIKNKDDKVIYSKELTLSVHKFAQLFAWGDGRDFEIEVAYHIR